MRGDGVICPVVVLRQVTEYWEVVGSGSQLHHTTVDHHTGRGLSADGKINHRAANIGHKRVFTFVVCLSAAVKNYKVFVVHDAKQIRAPSRTFCIAGHARPFQSDVGGDNWIEIIGAAANSAVKITQKCDVDVGGALKKLA